MKKTTVSLVVLIICAVAIASTFFLLDRKAPVIKTSSTPVLGCNVSYDDLMTYASATDDKEIKSFFIEEKKVNDIAEYGTLTYVAIDTSENVSKQRVSVEVDPAYKTFHIEQLQPLKAQINEPINIEEYVALKNGCGHNVDEVFVIDGVNYNKEDTYDVTITPMIHHKIEPVKAKMTVGNLHAPVIVLKETEITDESDSYYSDGYFLRQIDHIEDDTDSSDALLENVTTNWKEVLTDGINNYVGKVGTYVIKYTVSDSDGNTGEAELSITLEAKEPATTEESGGEANG